jgi:N-acyl homoserine lactone hydrolase
MHIQALSTGTVLVKHSFLYASSGWRRQPDLFLPGPFSEPLPIHVWVVEHAGRRWLIDTGETAAVNNVPFARFDVSPNDELPAQLQGIGLTTADFDTVVLTHMHGDHMDGAVHLSGPVLVHDAELAFTRTPFARFMSKVLRQPVPASVDFQTITLGDGPFGAFPASHRLSDDGRIVAVPTPGHTVGHISVVCIDDFGRHVMLAGDVTDTLEQLHDLRADAVAPKPAVHRETMRRILDHAREHATVFLPTHDPESAARLAARTVLSV